MDPATSALIARVIAALFAAAGAAGIPLVLYGQHLDQATTTKVVIIIVSAIGSVYGAIRTWRSKQVTPRPPGPVVGSAEHRALLADRKRLHGILAAQVRQTIEGTAPL